MTAYATQTEFEAYVEGWVTDDAAALGRLLERASRDLDNLVFVALAPLASGTYSGFRLDPGNLVDWASEALSRATCAQAEYRFDTGEAEWAAIGHGGTVSGPDFTVEVPKGPAGGRPRLAPKAALELAPLRPWIAGGARAVS